MRFAALALGLLMAVVARGEMVPTDLGHMMTRMQQARQEAKSRPNPLVVGKRHVTVVDKRFIFYETLTENQKQRVFEWLCADPRYTFQPSERHKLEKALELQGNYDVTVDARFICPVCHGKKKRLYKGYEMVCDKCGGKGRSKVVQREFVVITESAYKFLYGHR